MGSERYIIRIDDRLLLMFINSGLCHNTTVMAMVMERVLYLAQALLGDVTGVDNTYNDLRISLKEHMHINLIEDTLYLIEDVTSYYLNILTINNLLSADLVVLDVNNDEIVVTIDHNTTRVRDILKH